MPLLILGLLLAVALASAARPTVKRVRPNYWPRGWPDPPAEFLTAVDAAVKEYQVKAADLIAFAFVESSFNPFAVGRVQSATWRKIADRPVMKGERRRWRDYYREGQCRAIGIMGLMPFNFIGVDGGFVPGTPIERGFEITMNVRMAARLLRELYDRTGDWVSAYHGYNPGGGEVYYERFRRAREVFNAAAKHVS